MLHRVFVYGTLKQGEPNHHWFSKDPGLFKLISEATTTERYPLIIGTKYNIPFLLYKPDVGHNVSGELYEVDDKVFANLDTLEDHPNFYERQMKPVQTTTDETIDAWIYFIRKFQPHLLNQEMYTIYSSKGPHGKQYVDSEESTLDDLNQEILHN